jgi:hypothetical protein
MKRLAPGVYDDERGGLHLDLGELLIANGFADTDQNRATMMAVWAEWCASARATLHVVESITCPRCGARSFHPTDRAERYCGACHRFHQD